VSMTPAELRPYFKFLRFALIGLVVLFGAGHRVGHGLLPPELTWILCEVLLALAGAILIAYGFAVLHEKRLLENLPESKARSVAMGLAEIVGTAQQKDPLLSPITGIPCVYYRYTIEEERRDSRGRSRWEVIDDGRSSAPFYLGDETGRILVEPAGAEMILREGYRKIEPKAGWGSNRIRTIEWRIVPQQRICVLGTVTKTCDEIYAHRATLREHLQQLKGNPEHLKQFDTNRDGTLDEAEWAVAVQAVKQEVLKEEMSRPQPPPEDEVAIGQGTDEKTFVIADRSEASVARGLGWKAGAALVIGPLLVVLVTLSALARSGWIPGGLAIPWDRLF
jgi:E3 ubiquitin ligase